MSAALGFCRTARLRLASAGAGSVRPLATSSAGKAAASVDHASPDGGSGSSGGWSWTSGLLLVPAGIAAYLGNWQVERRQWKVDLINSRKEMLKEEPTDVFALQRGLGEYLPVKARGVLQHAQTVYVGPRVKSAMGTATSGHVVITPMYSKEWHRSVLVNRGWAPDGWRSGSAEDPQAGKQVVEVSGVARLSERPNNFVPDNKPAEGRWFWIDAPTIAESCGLPADTPLLEVFDRSDGLDTAAPQAPTPMEVLARRKNKSAVSPPVSQYPQPLGIGDLVHLTVMPDDHRNYAIIWYSLATITAGMAVKAITMKRRRAR